MFMTFAVELYLFSRFPGLNCVSLIRADLVGSKYYKITNIKLSWYY